MSAAALLLNRALAERMDAARRRTDQLFDLLKPKAIYSRPIAERHRLIFYLGHLEAFDWNQIARNTLGASSLHAEFDKLFEFGIDPPVGQAAQDQPSDWPSVREVLDYNGRVRASIDTLLEAAPEQIVHVAIEHRLMHAETLAYLFHNLPYDQKLAPAGPGVRHSETGLRPERIDIPQGEATLGQQAGEFGWDNEFREHRVHVPAFSIGKYKVTNGQYLEFVRAGAPAPNFWIERGGEWLYRGMFAEIPLPLNAPVYVTHQEACNYARWAERALPTEAQFHRAAYGTPEGSERAYPWGSAAPDMSRGNFDFHWWDPIDVDSTPAGDSAFGVSQMVGNGWEWTATIFGPFPGFEPFAFYPGYSKNFFDEEHYVIKGASPRTDACMLRRSFRNWFRPNYPYVYASFRLTEN
ncbi:MAG TPA: SUMF1/EgtB/PvdO family nonheme iron enzyme [Bryobacteraceae bacterium]|nr:SUMF1/EgtB/PvdO family nonheme iron enzyme [Bryobacteraceae bacterium]